MKRTSSLEVVIQSLEELSKQNGALRDDLARLHAFLSKIRSGTKWMSGLDTINETITKISSLAEHSFRDHVLTEEGPNQWHCGKPGTGIYSFRVAQLNGAVVIWGDIGSMIIDAGKSYTVNWLRGSVKSTHYVLEKCNVDKSCFYPGEFKRVLEWNLECAKENWDGEEGTREHAALKDAQKAIDSAAHYDFDVTAYHDYMQSHPDSEVHDSVFGYDPEAYWLVEGLALFVRLYEAALAASNQNVD